MLVRFDNPMRKQEGSRPLLNAQIMPDNVYGVAQRDVITEEVRVSKSTRINVISHDRCNF